MSQEKDDRKRPPLRLVVSNPDKRGAARPKEKEEEVFVSLTELVANRDMIRPSFYQGMQPWQAKGYRRLEGFLEKRGWPYGLDPHHGRVMVLPAAVICMESAEHDASQQDEVLLFIAEDAAGEGVCLSLETILPFWSDDETIMENALLYAPIHQYGTLFLEENRHDGLLDLVYRLAFPVYPPALTERLIQRFFAIAALELADTLQSLAGD